MYCICITYIILSKKAFISEARKSNGGRVLYLHISDECRHCNACVEACGKALSVRMLSCRHCADAPCVKACPKKAFFEVTPSVWAVDSEKCDGCGLCAKACPWGAIEIENYARKCDLCAGDPKCMKVCAKINLRQSEEEDAEAESILGWRKVNGEYLTGAYQPSVEEARVIGSMVKAYREVSKSGGADVEEIFDEYCAAYGIALDEIQKQRLMGIVQDEVSGLSVLELFLKDDALEEIVINGLKTPISVFHRKRGWMGSDIEIVSQDKAVSLINRIARGLGRRVTMQKPRINACLEDGSRLHAAIPPIVKEPVVTIRKFRKSPFSPAELAANGTITAEALAFLWMAIQCDLNIIIAGSTGSGKTTTLNALSAFIPLRERVIIVEETPEICIPHRHCVRLTVNSSLGIGMNELVSDTLRMRPDRVVVGEVRAKEEAKALMNTMLAGQGKGSVATFHALSGEECLTRLKSMGIAEMDLEAIGLIVVQRRWTRYDPMKGKAEEMRKVTEICEIDSGRAKALFRLDPRLGRLKKVGRGKIESRVAASFSCGMASELKRRETFLKNCRGSFDDSVAGIDRFVFGGCDA